MVEAAESALPLNMSPKCSVVDFSESGYTRTTIKSAGWNGHDTTTMNAASRTNLQSSSGLVGERLSASVGHDVKIKRVVKGLVKRDRLKFVKVNKGGDGSGSGEGCITQNGLLFIQFPPSALDATNHSMVHLAGYLALGRARVVQGMTHLGVIDAQLLWSLKWSM